MRAFSSMRVSALATAAALALTLLAAVFCLLIVAPAARAGDPPKASDSPKAVHPPKAIDPPKVGDRAPGFELEALGGGKVRLDTLLAKGPVVLVVLRGYPGYQCPYCTRQVGELIGRAKELADASAEVVLVYPGPADGLKLHAGEFVQGKGIPAHFSLVLDPDFAFTDRYGLRWDAPHETSYPSTFVIDRNGKVVFAKINHTHGDRAQPDEILKAVAKATP